MTEVEAWKLIRRGTGPLFDAEVVDALWAVLRKEEVADTEASREPCPTRTTSHTIPCR